MAKLVREEMTGAMKLDVPLKVDVAAGPNWLDVDRCLSTAPKPVIGLIGAIGAGKSTAARCFAARGGFVIDADALGHEALRQPDVDRRTRRAVGRACPKPDGRSTAGRSARIVFADPAERNALEAMVFPYIGERCRRGDRRGQADPAARFVVLDAAVMLEAGWNNEVRPDRLRRCAPRRSPRPARGPQRLDRAPTWPPAKPPSGPPNEKKARADAVIVNDADAGRVAGTGGSVADAMGTDRPRDARKAFDDRHSAEFLPECRRRSRNATASPAATAGCRPTDRVPAGEDLHVRHQVRFRRSPAARPQPSRAIEGPQPRTRRPRRGRRRLRRRHRRRDAGRPLRARRRSAATAAGRPRRPSRRRSRAAPRRPERARLRRRDELPLRGDQARQHVHHANCSR